MNMPLDYNAIWSEINSRSLTKSKASRIAEMSETGFKQMMKRKTMAVSTLEKLAKYFDKPIGYFFGNEEDGKINTTTKYPLSTKKDIVGEPQITLISCHDCIDKDKQIKKMSREKSELQTKYIDALEELRAKNGSQGCG